MSTILELGSAVRTRRSDMGLTQTTLAKLSGLSRATINQVENGTAKDLSLNRATKLLSVLGLSVTVAPPHPGNRQNKSVKSPALELAARTASVSYKNPVSASQLRRALTADAVPAGFLPHMHTLLDEAPITLRASVVEQLHMETEVERTEVWKKMRELARGLKGSRELWQ